MQPNLFEVEFHSDILDDKDLELLKYTCCAMEAEEFPNEIRVKLKFFADEDDVISDTAIRAFEANADFTVITFYSDGNVRREDRFHGMIPVSSKIGYSWFLSDKIGIFEINLSSFAVDAHSSVCYPRIKDENAG